MPNDDFEYGIQSRLGEHDSWKGPGYAATKMWAESRLELYNTGSIFENRMVKRAKGAKEWEPCESSQ